MRLRGWRPFEGRLPGRFRSRWDPPKTLASFRAWRKAFCCHAAYSGGAANSAADMPLIYAFVARQTTVLADYTSFTGNFATIAIQCLEKCPANDSRFTYTCDRHTFNYVVDNGFSKPHSVLTSPVGLTAWTKLNSRL